MPDGDFYLLGLGFGFAGGGTFSNGLAGNGLSRTGTSSHLRSGPGSGSLGSGVRGIKSSNAKRFRWEPYTLAGDGPIYFVLKF